MVNDRFILRWIPGMARQYEANGAAYLVNCRRLDQEFSRSERSCEPWISVVIIPWPLATCKAIAEVA
jgi:hypothetical protein